MPFGFGTNTFGPKYRLRYEPARDVFLALGRGRLLQSKTAAENYVFDSQQPLNQPHGLSHTSVAAADPHEAEA